MLDLFSMGQYTSYVWTAYGFSVALLAANALWSHWQLQRTLKQLKSTPDE